MSSPPPATVEAHFDERVAEAVRTGLASAPKRLPPWLFYDAVGSQLFEEITELPEYYLTRTERSILACHAGDIVRRAACGRRLRITELGAGSAAKTCLLLSQVVARQGEALYEPIDVSVAALLYAKMRTEREVPGVRVRPLAMDYTNGFALDPAHPAEHRLVLYIGSSIGNFEPDESARLLRKLRAQLQTGDSLLLGVDLVKDVSFLHSAYDDAAGITAAFNKNILAHLNRELGANFDPEAFRHRAIWNEQESRIEMHLVSQSPQRVRIAALDLEVEFAAGESIHTENSYKYRPGQAEALLAETGFASAAAWKDARDWFMVCLARAE